jgi:hypothetical protein
MRRLLTILLGLLLGSTASFAQFTHVRGASHGASGTTNAVALGAAPTTGHLVVVAACPDVAVTALTVKDANNNSYTITPHSPSTVTSGAGQCWMAYLLSAPANASATINISWTGAANVAGFADEFSYTGGTATFDTDIAANTATAGTTINTPSITPAASGELLFAGAAAGGTISGVGGTWATSGGAILFGDDAEYILSSASGATAVNFAQSSGGWSSMAIAIKLVSAGGAATMPPVVY